MKDAWRFIKSIYRSQVRSHEKVSHWNMMTNVLTEFVETVPRSLLVNVWLSITLVMGIFLGTVVGLILSNMNYLWTKKTITLIDFFIRGYFLGNWLIYIIFCSIVAIFLYVFWIKFKFNHQSLLEGHKATGRWTIPAEVEAQYKSVPSVPEIIKKISETKTDMYGYPIEEPVSSSSYPGLSGTIISRDNERKLAYLDTGASHNMNIGRTRSGKTQAKVLPDIDVYSRSEEKPHLIISSTKYELYASTYQQLIARGYDISVLNLIDLDRSFQFNNLELVKKAYKAGDVGEAIELCKTFSYPLYHNENAREPVWEDTAMALVNAIILALCYEFIEKTQQEKFVTMYSLGQMIVELGPDEGKAMSKLDTYFDSLPPDNPARTEYSTVRTAQGQMRSSIFASTQAKVRSFTAPMVASLMAKSTFDFDRLLVGYHKKETFIFKKDDCLGKKPIKIKVYSANKETLIKKFKLLPDSKRGINHEECRVLPVYSNDHVIQFEFHEERYIEILFGNGKREERLIEKNKPQAVFIVLPDFVQTNYIIASTWLEQFYYVVSKHASHLPGDKLSRRIRCVLDEFFNFPALSSINSMISVGAGRGILFDFYAQDVPQIVNRYNEHISKFILSQSMNIFFIHSSNDETNKWFSSILGNKEVITKSRSGQQFGDKTITETPETRPLMMADELGRLKEGEVVVYRSGTRRDLKGRLIVPFPIHNDGNSRLMYSYEYLEEAFPPNNRFEELDLPVVEQLDLKEYMFKFSNRVLRLVPDDEQENKRLPMQKTDKEMLKMIEKINKDPKAKALGIYDRTIFETDKAQESLPLSDESVNLQVETAVGQLSNHQKPLRESLPPTLYAQFVSWLYRANKGHLIDVFEQSETYLEDMHVINQYDDMKEWFETYIAPRLDTLE